MKILAIGEGAQPVIKDIYPEAEVDSTTLMPGRKRKDYDVVYSHLCLQSVPYRNVSATMQAWVDALKTGGEFALLVPSLEWAVEQVYSPNRSPVLMAHLFGPQDNPGRFYSSAFTMMDLRSLCSICGIAVTHASLGEYFIGDNPCGLNTVRGIKK